MSIAMPRPPPEPPVSTSFSAPSPSRANPFARPAIPKASSSFTRTSLLPTIPSPAKSAKDGTPAGKVNEVPSVGSAGKGRSAWRMLWRGGLEIGREGYRLEGITFFALLNFPSTPTNPIANPFDVPLSTPSHLPNPTSAHSPFALPSADTDICLSLESMRGRKHLHIRGLTDLADTDVLEGSDEASGGGVQMAIAPTSLLVAYFTSLLCRDSDLSPTGRTRRAIRIGLGDDDSPQNTLLVYGQLQPFSTTLRLLVSRRKPPPPPPSEVKVRPGEPLPRVPLFFPANARKPLPFPNRSNLGKSRSFSRTSSVSSIYAPPVSAGAGAVEMPLATIVPGQAPAPVSGRTPGRRGEKRPRTGAEDEERRRKAGRVVMIREEPVEVKLECQSEGGDDIHLGPEKPGAGEEDIFGKRPTPAEGVNPSSDTAVGEASANSKKRPRVPQQVLDNKALIRKQAMVLMEARGYPREHEQFKDIFAMTTKGVCFVFRDALLDAPLDKLHVQSFVTRHLDMYLPAHRPGTVYEASGEDTAADDETLVSIKDEVDVKEEEDAVLFPPEDVSSGGLGEALPVGLLDDGSRRSSMSRSRSMGVVEEEEEAEV